MMPLELTYFAADYYSALEAFAAVVAILILISSCDDLFIDLWYWGRRIYRRFAIEPDHRRLSAAQLQERAEQHMAIMVPAWLEYDVIAQMIENMVAVLDYRHYVVFIGTYVNDTATIDEVERMRVRYSQLRRVEVPHPGPTCKADCLNWIVQDIFNYENENNIEFAGIVLHDSEDVLHPLELKFFNYLLPRKDMIQLPVASLEREWYELVAGTYMDEFAESHAKDMTVRESVAHIVPSAGVGTCFSRRAMLALRQNSHGQPFNTDSLTEDYDVGMRLSRMGMHAIFTRFSVQFHVHRRDSWFGSGKSKEILLEMPLCVREYFPNTFRAAYRQKARWVLGIGLQSWEQIGWRGSLAARYLMLHDRKGVVTAFISMLAYLLVLQFILFYVASAMGMWTDRFPPFFDNDGWWRTVIYFNAAAMISRVAHRIYFVTPLYGWRHGLMSVPRLVVANFVNFMAVCRAWRLFLAYLVFGTPLVWDKTMHDFPDSEKLARKRQRLGDLLKNWQAVDEGKLEHAIEEQRRTHLPLGSIMVSHGWLDDETLAEALAYQERLPRAPLTRELLRMHADGMPIDVALRMRAIYIGRDADSRPAIAVASPLAEQDRAALETLFGIAPAQKIVRESEIASGLRFLVGKEDAFDKTAGAGNVPLLGDLLVVLGLLERNRFESAMQRYRPERHGRIGDYLVEQGVIAREYIEQAVSEQRRLALGPAEQAA